jgi:hypothetical protein
MNSFWNEKIKDFVSNAGVFVIKGIALFLVIGLFFTFIDFVGLIDFETHITPKANSLSLETKILIVTITGAVSHYTFWKT